MTITHLEPKNIQLVCSCRDTKRQVPNSIKLICCSTLQGRSQLILYMTSQAVTIFYWTFISNGLPASIIIDLVPTLVCRSILGFLRLIVIVLLRDEVRVFRVRDVVGLAEVVGGEN